MFETVVKVPGTSVYVGASVPVNDIDAANREANYLLDVVIPHAVIKIRNITTGVLLLPKR